MGALSCGLIFFIGRKFFGRVAGAVAGFAFAFYGMAIYSDGEILPTTLFMFFMLLAVWFLIKYLTAGDTGTRFVRALPSGSDSS